MQAVDCCTVRPVALKVRRRSAGKLGMKPAGMMYRHSNLAWLALLLCLGSIAPALAQPQGRAKKTTSCHGGISVMVDPSSGLYHFRGGDHYGPQAKEVSMCRRMAEHRGFHLRGAGTVWDGAP